MVKSKNNYDYGDMGEIENRVRGDMYGIETMKWHGWGSPVGLGLFLVSIGVFLWMLHLANIIH